jgi:hypothetical protein
MKRIMIAAGLAVLASTTIAAGPASAARRLNPGPPLGIQFLVDGLLCSKNVTC